MIGPDLNAAEIELLKWLGKTDYSQYGECTGPTFDSLVEKGLAQVHAEGEYQVILSQSMLHRAVSLTERGRARLRGA
jgi:hypothetical protein